MASSSSSSTGTISPFAQKHTISRLEIFRELHYASLVAFLARELLLDDPNYSFLRSLQLTFSSATLGSSTVASTSTSGSAAALPSPASASPASAALTLQSTPAISLVGASPTTAGSGGGTGTSGHNSSTSSGSGSSNSSSGSPKLQMMRLERGVSRDLTSGQSTPLGTAGPVCPLGQTMLSSTPAPLPPLFEKILEIFMDSSTSFDPLELYLHKQQTVIGRRRQCFVAFLQFSRYMCKLAQSKTSKVSERRIRVQLESFLQGIQAVYSGPSAPHTADYLVSVVVQWWLAAALDLVAIFLGFHSLPNKTVELLTQLQGTALTFAQYSAYAVFLLAGGYAGSHNRVFLETTREEIGSKSLRERRSTKKPSLLGVKPRSPRKFKKQMFLIDSPMTQSMSPESFPLALDPLQRLHSYNAKHTSLARDIFKSMHQSRLLTYGFDSTLFTVLPYSFSSSSSSSSPSASSSSSSSSSSSPSSSSSSSPSSSLSSPSSSFFSSYFPSSIASSSTSSISSSLTSSSASSPSSASSSSSSPSSFSSGGFQYHQQQQLFHASQQGFSGGLRFVCTSAQKKLRKLLLKAPFQLVETLCLGELQNPENESIFYALVVFFDSENMLISLFDAIFHMEVDKAPMDQTTLFRGDSPFTKLTYALFSSPYGIKFLMQLVQPFLETLASSDLSLEVDPTKLANGQTEALQNVAHLVRLTQGLLDHIRGAIAACPPLFRMLFAAIRRRTKAKFSQMEVLIVGAFFFLRFICPAIVSPQKYVLLSIRPSPKLSRTLILISKLLQALANGVLLDGSKEDYFNFPQFNQFISANLDEVKMMLDDISVMPPEITARSPASSFLELPLEERMGAFQQIESRILSHAAAYLVRLPPRVARPLAHYLTLKEPLLLSTLLRANDPHALSVQNIFSKLTEAVRLPVTSSLSPLTAGNPEQAGFLARPIVSLLDFHPQLPADSLWEQFHDHLSAILAAMAALLTKGVLLPSPQPLSAEARRFLTSQLCFIDHLIKSTFRQALPTSSANELSLWDSLSNLLRALVFFATNELEANCTFVHQSISLAITQLRWTANQFFSFYCLFPSAAPVAQDSYDQQSNPMFFSKPY